MSALLAFLGGNAFRMIFGEAVAFFQRRQEQAQELERMKLQGQLDAAQHERTQEAIKTQAALGVQTIRVQGEEARGLLDAEAWKIVSEATTRLTGIKLVDAWNQSIRPAVATWAVVMITGHYAGAWVLDDNGWAVCGAALGIYIADRTLFKRGK